MEQSIKQKVAFFFILLFFIAIISYAIVNYALRDGQVISKTIKNVSEDQLLIEKMRHSATSIYYEGKDLQKVADIENAIQQFGATSQLLGENTDLSISTINGRYYLDVQEEIDSLWTKLKADLTEITTVNQVERRSINSIENNSDKLNEILTLVVNDYYDRGIKLFQGKNIKVAVIILLNLSFVIIILIAGRMYQVVSESEKRYRLLVEHSPIGIILYKENIVNYANEFALQSLGFSKLEDAVGKSVFTYVEPDFVDVVKERLDLVQNKHEVVGLTEQTWKNVDGSKIHVNVVSLPFEVMGEQMNLTIFNDITKLIEKEDERAAKHRELNNLKTALVKSRIVEVVDSKGLILYANDKSAQVSKCDVEEMLGKTHASMVAPNYTKDFLYSIWNKVNEGFIWEGHLKYIAKDGTHYWTNTLIIPFINNDGQPYEYLIVREDITHEVNLEKELQDLTTKDEVTNLPKRKIFNKDLKKSIELDELIGIIYVGLDRFKYINDSLGHAVGDQLLTEVGNRLQKVVPEAKNITRQGGDQFTILVNNVDRDYLAKLSEKIIDKINEPYFIAGKEIYITCRIGLTVYPSDGNTGELLLKRAFFAMEYAKSQMKDRYSFYDKDMESVMNRLLVIENDIRQAVAKEQFELYYQPKIDLKTNKIIGNEALIRWNHNKLGPISPMEFIPIAEEIGLINEIGNWVIKEASRQTKEWHEAGFHGLSIAVNVSAHQFKDHKLCYTIKSILEETGLEAKYLELEITESISMFPEQETLNQLKKLKSLGVSLALDDFGTGYSSLRYLQDFPIDTVKIDRSFISENSSKQIRSKLMTNAIISLASTLNMTIVAEGIESREQLSYLEQQNCHIGQGYYISKPLPSNKLAELYLKKDQFRNN